MSYLLSTSHFFAHSENLHCTEAENPDVMGMAAVGAGGGHHPRPVCHPGKYLLLSQGLPVPLET